MHVVCAGLPLLRGHAGPTPGPARAAVPADMPDGSTVLLWRKNPPPPEPTRYNLTAFRWVTG